MPYNPPTRVTTVERPWLSVVNQNDPEGAALRYRQLEAWEGGEPIGRPRYFNPQTRGAYNRRSNVYAVGQPHGDADAAITAALAPTVGNTTPGLYEGVDDGAGWA